MLRLIGYTAIALIAVCFVILYVEYKMTMLRRHMLEFEEGVLKYMDTKQAS